MTSKIVTGSSGTSWWPALFLFYKNWQAGFAQMRARNAALWKTVFAEDIASVEGMQRGRHGVAFDGGRFSPAMDGPTHRFHAWVAARMDADATREA